jgi:hypothetical protein
MLPANSSANAKAAHVHRPDQPHPPDQPFI